MYTRQAILPFAVLSALAAVLTFIAAGAGLFVAGFYEPVLASTTLRAGAYGQDLLALVAAALILAAIALTWRGSARAVMVWAGALGYLIYGYLLYAFDAVYTPLYLVYIAILGLSLYSLIGLLARLDAGAFREHVRASFPARSTAAVLAIPILFIPPWLAFILEGMAQGQSVTINSVLVIDLAFLIPACLLSAVLVWRRRTWGYVFAGPLLVQITTLGLSLSIATVWGVSLGAPQDPLLPVYAVMAVVGVVAIVRYLRHIGRAAETAPPVVTAATG